MALIITRTAKTVVFALFLVVGNWCAGSMAAQLPESLEQGTWYKSEEMSAHLRAAGHRPVAFMSSVLVSGNKSTLFTVDQDGSWYMLQGNAEQGSSTQFFVSLTGENMQVNDYRTGERPDFSYRDYDRSKFHEEASVIAKNLGMSISAAFYEDVITGSANQDNEFIVMQAETSNGKLITLTANPNSQKFTLNMTWPGEGGVTLLMGHGHNLTLSQQMISQFEAP